MVEKTTDKNNKTIYIYTEEEHKQNQQNKAYVEYILKELDKL